MYSHKKSYGQIRSEIEKGRATRKGTDGGKGGQTQSLQERADENRRQSANLGRNGKEKKNWDQPGQGDSEQEGHGKGAREGGWGMERPEDA